MAPSTSAPDVGDARTGAAFRARAAVAATFAAHAAISGSLGPWIPQLKANAGLDAGGLGVALAFFAGGLVVGTRIADPAMRRLGARPVLRVGVPALAAGLALLSFAHSLVALAAVFALFGLFGGLVDVAMNAEAVRVEDRFGRAVMSSMHGTWSVSMLGGATVAAVTIAADVPIEGALAVTGSVLVAASFPLLRWLPLGVGAVRPAPDANGGERGSTVLLALLCLVGFASFLVEGTAAEWSAVYLHDSVGASLGVAGLGVVAFSAGMATSRFAGDRLQARIGAPLLLRVGAAIGGVALAIAIGVHEAGPTLAALVILGLGLGCAVPFVFGAAGRVGRSGGRTGLALVVTASYLGSIVGPLVVGLTADRVGLRAAFAIPVAMCAAIALAAGATRRRDVGG